MSDVSLASIEAAAERIRPYVHRTPVVTSKFVDDLVGGGRKVFFKCELFQKTGSFKSRGACNAVMKLTPEDAEKGVVTHSSGNHAQALAFAAGLRGIPAHIVMPNNASKVKQQAVAGYGGTVVLCEPSDAAREATCEELRVATGAKLVHPSNDLDVISGQGTLALEALEQIGDLLKLSPSDLPFDAFIVPLGGGGLISGVATALKGRFPSIKVYGAEPSAADDAFRSKAEGRLIKHETAPDTVADGLKTCLGTHTFPIVASSLVDGIIRVEEIDIISATRTVWERMKLCIEPTAGVGLAALVTPEFLAIPGLHRVCVLLCGGNADVTKLPWIHPDGSHVPPLVAK